MPEGKGNIPVLPTIRANLENMTGTQRRIGEYILRNPRSCMKMSISQLAEATGARSESTVVRFYRLLGFAGYHDFKVTLATDIAGKSFYHSYEDITRDDDVAAIKEKISQGASRAIHESFSMLREQELDRAVELLESSTRVFLLGYATSAALAYDAYFKFTAIGLNCYHTRDSHMNAVLLSEPRAGDVIFAISHSGETRDVVEPSAAARPVARVIALTGYPGSQLGQIADVCLATVSEELNYRSDAIVSRIVQMTVIGTIFAALSVRRGVEGENKLKNTRQSLSYLKY